MKDSYGYLLKLSIVLIVLLLILQTSLEFFTSNTHVPTEYFTQSSPSSANFKNATSQYPHSATPNNAQQEKITINLDKGILGQILGVDLKKMIDKKSTVSADDTLVNVNEDGEYVMPDYEYCDMRNWIPKEAVRSLCPTCDPDKL